MRQRPKSLKDRAGNEEGREPTEIAIAMLPPGPVSRRSASQARMATRAYGRGPGAQRQVVRYTRISCVAR